MSEHIGLAILRAVGKHYREHPESLSVGFGRLYGKCHKDSSYVWQPGDDCCIHTTIMYFGAKMGGDDATHMAIMMLCAHHRIPREDSSLHFINDKFESVQQAIEFVEAPLHYKLPSDDSQVLPAVKVMQLRAAPAAHPAKLSTSETLARVAVLAFIVLGAVAFVAGRSA